MPPLIIKANTKKGYEAANYGDSVNYSLPTSKTRRGRVGKGVAQTLDTAVNQGVVQPKIVSYTRDAKGKVTNRTLKDQANTIHSSVGGGGNTDQFVQPVQLGQSSQTFAHKSGTIIGKENQDAFTIRSSNPNGVQVIQPNYSSKALNETIMNNDLQKGKVQALDLYNRSARDESPTLTEPHHNTLRMFDGARIRRLTPIECERLQGFPDNHTEYGDYDGEVVKVSNTQRYKQCGNAVTVDVVQAVAEKCKPLFK
jgi:DNA (cytosine-5)-methyltransferase 1